LVAGAAAERIDLRGVASGTLVLTLKNQHTIKQYKLMKRLANRSFYAGAPVETLVLFCLKKMGLTLKRR